MADPILVFVVSSFDIYPKITFCFPIIRWQGRFMKLYLEMTGVKHVTESHFCRDVVTPIYEVIRKVVITLFGHCYLHFCLLYANFFLNYHCLVKKEARKTTAVKQVIRHGETMTI